MYGRFSYHVYIEETLGQSQSAHNPWPPIKKYYVGKMQGWFWSVISEPARTFDYQRGVEKRTKSFPLSLRILTLHVCSP